MKIKKLTYILMAALLLTACGKTDTKENTEKAKVEKEEDKHQTNEASEQAEETMESSEAVADEEQEDTVQASNGDNDKDNTTQSNSASTDNNSNTQSSTEKSTPSNSTTQNSSNTSNNQTTQKEEVQLGDNINSDASNYSPTDSQLKSESDVNASKYMSYYQEVLRLVNEIRAEVGVAPLTLDTTLCKAASMRAVEMDYSGVFSHTRPSGESCFSVLDDYNVSYMSCGENIAAGQSTPAQVVNAWKNSSGHYANMIDASFTKLGVGYSATGVGAYGHYWCQLFTN